MPKAQYKPYQVPIHLYKELEKRAISIRKHTGKDIKWTEVLKSIIEKEVEQTKKGTQNDV